MDRAESSPGLLTTRKFQSFPVVNSTCGWLSDSYSKIKAANFVTKCTCQVAESTIKNSMYLASPIVSTFKTQVKCLDSLAFNQLERLENAFPIIKSDAGNIVSQSKELINKTVEPVSTSLENFKTTTRDSVKNCFSRTSKKGQNLANIVLDYSQNFMEQYLIYSDLKKDTEGGIESEKTSALTYYEEYAKLNQKRYHDVIYRIQMLTYVFYKSLHNNMVNQAKLVLEIINLTFAKLYALLEWFDLYRKRLLSSTKDKLYLTKDKIDLYKEYLDVLSKQFTVQDGRSLYHVHSLEDRTKIIIRRSLGNLIIAFHLVYSRVSNVTPIVNNRFKAIGQFIVDLYQIYSKNDGSFNEILVDTILQEVGEVTYKTQALMNSLIKKLNNSQVIQWFVPNFETFGVLDYDFEEFAISRPQISLKDKDNFGLTSSEEEIANAFSPECTYSSDFSNHNSANSIQNNKSSCCDISNIN